MASRPPAERPIEDILVFRPNPRGNGRPVAKIGGKLVILGERFQTSELVQPGESWKVRVWKGNNSTYYYAEPIERVHAPRTASPERTYGPSIIGGVLIEPLNVVETDERVAIFVDAANIERSLTWDIDYAKALDYFLGMGRFAGAYYHTVEDDAFRPFHDQISHAGFTVRRKTPWRTSKESGERRLRTHVEADLVIEFVSALETFDVAFIFSGDSDYAPLVKWAQMRGKRVYAVTARERISGELAYAVNKPIFHLEDFRTIIERKPPTQAEASP